MELNKEPIFTSEIIYDGEVEQGVEFDYVLPDYYPDIFKVLKCTLNPCIVSYSISGTQFFCDGVVYIKVLYLSENCNDINCIEQRYTYSKTIDLAKSGDKLTVKIKPTTDYCNCRAVTGRRIDVRGAVSNKIKITNMKQSEIITSITGKGIETKQKSFSYCGDKIIANKQFTVREDIETGEGKSGIIAIISVDAVPIMTDCKIIANKVIIKGETNIKALYITKSEASENRTEVMEAVIPISQIVDMDGISDQHNPFVNISVLDCDLEIKPSDIGENRILSCEMTLDCTISAYKECVIAPLCDMYSTNYESDFTVSTIKTELAPIVISEQLGLKTLVECTDGKLSEILDSRAELKSIVVKTKSANELLITGQTFIQILAKQEDGRPIFLEKNEPFELSFEVPTLPEEYSIDSELIIKNISYNISRDNLVELRMQINFKGQLAQLCTTQIINDIVLNEDKPKEVDTAYALKLYYASGGETVWDIAKTYNSSVLSVMEENDLEEETLHEACMLLVSRC